MRRRAPRLCILLPHEPKISCRPLGRPAHRSGIADREMRWCAHPRARSDMIPLFLSPYIPLIVIYQNIHLPRIRRPIQACLLPHGLLRETHSIPRPSATGIPIIVHGSGLDANAHQSVVRAGDVEIGFEVQHVVVDAGGELVLHSITVLVGLVGGPVCAFDVAACAHFDFDRSVEVENVVETVIVVPNYRGEADDEIGVSRDGDVCAGGVALQCMICGVFEEADCVLMQFGSFCTVGCGVDEAGIWRAVIAFLMSVWFFLFSDND